MRRLRNLLAVTTAMMPLAFPAFAGPTGGVVVGGSGTITNPGTSNVRIDQFTDRMIINWYMFNIGAGEVTTFFQPNSNSIALNRVTGGMGPSEILGALNANGKVFVVNRDGIIFGAGAVINTAGFLATTSDIKNEDFMAGRFNFQIPGRPDASIVNMGTITAANGGFAALVAPGVRNSGTITANLGTVTLAAGNLFNLDFYGDKLITLGVGDQIASQVKDVATGETLKSLVTNEGKLKANGGRVELSAAAARTVVDSVINTSGVIEANSIGTHNGRIVLSAATGTGSNGAWGTPGPALPKQTVRVSGKLSAAGKRAGTKGGTILVTGQNIEVRGATIDASGRDGGGKVMIGGDWGGGKPDRSLVSNQSAKLEDYAIPNASAVSVDAATRIDASAKDRGDGGKVVLWANDHLTFTGTILALGGSQFGNGGFVETSAHSVDITGQVNAGHGGTWLLDPADLLVTSALAASIQAALNNGTNYVAQTATTGSGNGDIIFDSGVRIAWNTSATLTLIAFRNIKFNDGGFGPEGAGNIVNYGGAAGNLVMRADSTGTGVGTLIMTPFTNPTRINWTNSTGTISLYYNPANFGTQDNFTTGNGNIALASAGQLTQYMLVNDKAHLQNISTNLAGNYALGRDIDASGGLFNPLGTFTGVFDGSGGIGTAHTISNLTIAPTNPVNFGIGVGLFSAIGFGGTVKNLHFDHASVTANPNATGPGQFVGVLAGTNAGTISGVNITNSTVSSATGLGGVIAGGLVGQNGDIGAGHFGTITLSNAQVDVTVGSATSGSSQNSAGGLVGDNPGTITFSSASGIVTGGANSNIGGLVGRNETGASIVNSAASGDVNLTDATGSTAGGLVGFNFGMLNTVGATGNVTAGNSANIFAAGFIGGLVGMNDAAGTITGGVAGGNVSAGSGTSVGGLVGQNGGAVTNSTAAGNVSGTGSSGMLAFVGGLIGSNKATGTITNSHATGAVNTNGFAHIGGLIGDNGANLSNLSADNAVTSFGPNVAIGGLIGYNTGALSNSHATGNVFVNVDNASCCNAINYVGGLIGYSTAVVSGSYAIGNVAVSQNNTTSGFANDVGGLIGYSSGAVLNSYAGGNVSSTANSEVFSSTNIGGLIGYQVGSTVTNSYATGTVSDSRDSSVYYTADNVGGLIGWSSATVSDSHATGNVSASSNRLYSFNVGGLIGNQSGSTVSNTFATGDVSSISNGHGFFGTVGVGGLIGYSTAAVTGSHATGNISSTNIGSACCDTTGVGGLIGYSTAAVSDSYATGAVSASQTGTSTSNAQNVGGLIGYSTAAVSGSHATGTVSVSGVLASVGGLIGYQSGSTVTNSYATGRVSSTNSGNVCCDTTGVGGLIGYSTAAVSDSYATGAVSASQSGSTTSNAQDVGGLIGYSGGSISGSHALGAVSFNGRFGNVGGLVGYQSGSAVSDSYASGNVTSTFSLSNCSCGFVGGLIGYSTGNIIGSNASGAVIATNSFLSVGGLIGEQFGGVVTNSFATGNVTLTLDGAEFGFGSAGGLIGTASNANITSSHATGAVTANIAGAIDPNLFYVFGSLGGLVGGANGGSIANSYATGNVVGPASSAGGLVGSASLTSITDSHATGNVDTSALGPLNNTGFGFFFSGTTGGLVGSAFGGAISNSYATGNVKGSGAVGGLVGADFGNITNSYATGNVTGLGQSFRYSYTYTYIDPVTGQPVTVTYTSSFTPAVGGLVGIQAGGTISNSHASGNVTGRGYVGGLVGITEGNIDNSYASGTVTEAPFVAASVPVNGSPIFPGGPVATEVVLLPTIIGGLVGVNSGTISNSQASGAVSAGDAALVGGFAGLNNDDGVIRSSSSSGAVTGTSDSYLGGFVGFNTGLIQDASTAATSSVTGTGSHNFAGGLVGINFGTIDPSHSAGNVSSGANSIVGAFVGANAAIRLADGTEFIGTVDAASSGSGTVSGGAGSAVGGQVGKQYPLAGLPQFAETCDGAAICGGTLFNPSPDVPAPPTPTPPDLPTVSPLVNITQTLVADTFTDKTNDPVVTITQSNTPSGQGGGAGGRAGGAGGQRGGTANNGGRPPANVTAQYGLGPLPSGMPPANETRFLTNEVMFQLGANLSDQAIQRIAEQLGLQIAYQENVGLLGRKVIRFIITNGQPVRQIIAALEKEGANFSAQPLYQFQLTQDTAQNAPADTNTKGDSAQYVVEKLGLVEAHLIATGKNVKVAVIDSEIDANHPDLQGAVTGSYDALPSDDQTAHPHGTGMAGAIASHKRLLGVAPSARLLAVRAFGVNTGGAQGTSLNIVKGLQWAVDQGAKVINMSFAGPKDPILQQAIKRLTDQGIILIAAAGNAGPKSPPLYPGADPNVIAVSATDIDNKTFKGANRGKYVAIAAPGVDILVPAPEGGYQLTTGTSVAAAHISGVVALMLERNKELKPAEVRAILSATAKNIGEPRTDVGAGLVDPVQALSKAGPKQASAQ